MEKIKLLGLLILGAEDKQLARFWRLLILVILFVLPLVISKMWICLLTEVLILGLAGMSVNLLLGYSGSLPFGHACFYAAGAYATAILMKETEIPLGVVMIIAPVCAAAIGAIFGLIIARLYKFYYAMMTLALSMLIWNLIRKWTSLTEGDMGITGLKVPAFLSSISGTYYFTLVIVWLCIIILWLFVNSPFGWTLRAIRENPTRALFLSVNVYLHRYLAFIISSFFAGLAGFLYVVYSKSTFPDYAYWVKSGDMVMVCILGGMLWFLGPMIGAAIMVILQTRITSVTIYWPLFMGAIICVVVLLMPYGVMGIWERLKPYVTQGLVLRLKTK